MTEGLRELLLMPNETTALDVVLSNVVPYRADVVAAIETLRNAVARAAPGSMQTQIGQPVHAARASQTSTHGTSLPVCDVAALGVVTNDRNLVDCEACLALIRGSQPPCPNPECDQGMVERLATPAEVDAGHELGIAFDPCPLCQPIAVDAPSPTTAHALPPT